MHYKGNRWGSLRNWRKAWIQEALTMRLDDRRDTRVLLWSAAGAQQVVCKCDWREGSSRRGESQTAAQHTPLSLHTPSRLQSRRHVHPACSEVTHKQAAAGDLLRVCDCDTVGFCFLGAYHHIGVSPCLCEWSYVCWVKGGVVRMCVQSVQLSRPSTSVLISHNDTKED